MDATSAPALRVLVVEDDAVVALDLAEALRELGHAVVGVAHDAEDALAKAELRPDLALLDIHLGADDGINLAEELYVVYSVPVVFVSAYSDLETVTRARFSGAYGFITKPFTAAALRTAVRLAQAKHEELRRLRELAELHDAVLELTPVPLLVTDLRGLIAYINPAACAVLARPAPAALGLPLHEVVARLGAKPEDTGAALRSVVAGPQQVSAELGGVTRTLDLRADERGIVVTIVEGRGV